MDKDTNKLIKQLVMYYASWASVVGCNKIDQDCVRAFMKQLENSLILVGCKIIHRGLCEFDHRYMLCDDDKAKDGEMGIVILEGVTIYSDILQRDYALERATWKKL